MRKLKAVGLAAIAVLAMSAFFASAAQAQFTSNAYPTSFTATSALGNDVFSVDGSSVECAGHFSGSAAEASTTITVTPVYTNCKAFGFATATVNMNGCDYLFHDTGSNTAGKVTVVCPAGKGPITIVAGNCEVQVGAQGPLGSLTYTNAGANHIGVQANVSGITANRTKDGFLCPLTGLGHTLSTYKQGSAVTVEPKSGGTDLTVD